MKKNFKNTKFGKILNKVASNAIVRGAFKATGIGSPIIETIRNVTTPDGEDKPHKSTNVQWYVVLAVLIFAVYMGWIDPKVILDFFGL